MLHDCLRSNYIFCDIVNWCIEYLANNRAQNNASTPCIHPDVHHEQIGIMQLVSLRTQGIYSYNFALQDITVYFSNFITDSL